MYDRAIGNDAEVGAFLHHSRFAERNRKIRPGIFRAVVWLAIQMFVLEEHHRVVAADRDAQTTRYNERRRRPHQAQPSKVGETRIATLDVLRTYACLIPA